MAITALEYLLCTSLRAKGLLSSSVKLMDFGESNWYGDVPLDRLRADIKGFVSEPEKQKKLLDALEETITAKRKPYLFEIARIFYEGVLGASSYSAIDPLTPAATYRFNLNDPVPLKEQFDVCINAGTGEHIFNVLQFFKTVHELTAPRGFMLHSSPFSGWPDHGFFNFQPTIYFDLARTNRYDIFAVVIASIEPFNSVQISRREEFAELATAGRLPPNAHLAVLMRKPAGNAPFNMPMQGIYAGALSPEGEKNWRKLR